MAGQLVRLSQWESALGRLRNPLARIVRWNPEQAVSLVVVVGDQETMGRTWRFEIRQLHPRPIIGSQSADEPGNVWLTSRQVKGLLALLRLADPNGIGSPFDVEQHAEVVYRLCEAIGVDPGHVMGLYPQEDMEA